MDASAEQPKHSLKGFWSLFLTQFQGAFNDNAFKFIVIFMVLGKATADEWAPLVGFVCGAVYPFFGVRRPACHAVQQTNGDGQHQDGGVGDHDFGDSWVCF